MISKILSATIFWLVLAGVGEAAITQHWKLDETSSTTATATVGNNGAYVRDASLTTTTGPGGSITLGQDFVPASSDAVDISGASISFTSGAAFSVSFWAEWDATTGRVIGTAGTNNHRILKVDDTTIRLMGNVTENNFTVASLGTSAWCHVLCTRTTGNVTRCFVNGVESSTGALALAVSFAPNRIGVSNATFMDGKVAQVKIFDSDESANVATLYAEGTGAAPAPVRRQAIVIGSLTRPAWQPADVNWRLSPFDAFFGAIAP